MQSNPEIEVAFYAQVGDINGLSQCESIEEHEQVEARLLNGHKVRVRKVKKKEIVQYFFTAKKKRADDAKLSDSMEYTSETTQDTFDALSMVAERRIVKTRYRFRSNSIGMKVADRSEVIRLDEVGFEVDVFKKLTDASGGTSSWIKVDVELQELMAFVKKQYPDIQTFALRINTQKLPFKPTKIIYPDKANEEEKKLIATLWSNEFSESLCPVPST